MGNMEAISRQYRQRAGLDPVEEPKAKSKAKAKDEVVAEPAVDETE